jgi:biopolymer transport protein ExbB
VKRFSLIICLAALILTVRAQDPEAIAAASRNDLREALDQLSALRGEIEAEKIPLAREVNTLERNLIDAREELRRKQRFQDNQLVELNALKSEVRARSEEVKYLETLLTEYSRGFRTRINILEEPAVKEALEPIEAAAASANLPAAGKLSRRMDLLRLSIERSRNVAGGHAIDAVAAGPDGRVHQGRGALFGPMALFVSKDGQVAGIVQQELNKADPTVVPLAAKESEGIKALVGSGAGPLPFDPTLGNALKIASTRETLREHIAKGGVVMWPILALAAIAAVVAVLKWLQLSKIKVATDSDLQLVLEQLKAGNRSAALARARAITGPAGLLLATAIEHADEKKEYLEEILYERMLNAKPRLEAYLPFIALTAAAAPLLGLLGTVTGMISTFNMISLFGTGDPRTLSGGISEALITTEWGLLVAIPAVLVHAFLNRRVKGILASMEHTAVGFINGIPGEEQTEPWAKL